MDGYKIVYSEPDGTITDTFFGEPMSSFSLSRSDYMDIVKMMFHNAHPNCKIISCERCTYENYNSEKE